MTIALAILFLMMQIVSLVLFIVVLIRLFKKEGALKGILGFFCGIYTFIWGWLKHKQLAMTKMMTVWSLMIVLPFILMPVLGVSSLLEMQKYVEAYTGDGDFKLSKPDSSSSLKKKLSAKKTSAQKPAGASAAGNADWSRKAMALWKNGQYTNPKKAVDYLNRAIVSKQNPVESYNNRGLAYHELKQYKKAIADFSQAIKLDPAHIAAYNNRGNAYYEMNEYELALVDFNRSLKRKPDYAKAHLNRGLVYYQMDQTDRACNDFKKACDHGDCDGTRWAMKNAICK